MLRLLVFNATLVVIAFVSVFVVDCYKTYTTKRNNDATIDRQLWRNDFA